jgi:hypothetical protein
MILSALGLCGNRLFFDLYLSHSTPSYANCASASALPLLRRDACGIYSRAVCGCLLLLGLLRLNAGACHCNSKLIKLKKKSSCFATYLVSAAIN